MLSALDHGLEVLEDFTRPPAGFISGGFKSGFHTVRSFSYGVVVFSLCVTALQYGPPLTNVKF
ncbi:hypothetical protein SBV1_1220059 [Verrucomicrobia bacterium]|nr:hypothetical protein SBV1_1220059 [Verrucomicrobiota bacterium]